MGAMRWLAALAAVAVLTVSAAHAAQGPDVYEAQKDALGLEGLEDAAGEHMDGFSLDGMDLDEGLRAVLDTGSGALPGVVRKAVRSCVLLLAVVLLCGLAEGLYGGLGDRKLEAVPLMGALAVTAVAVADVHSMLGLGTRTLEEMAGFANVLLPAVAALTAATGAITGAAARQMAAVLFSDVLMNTIASLLVPLVYAYLASSVGHAALGNDALARIAGMLKWAVTSILTGILLVFVGYLTVSGVVAGTADAASVKAAKFAMSSAVPVVGGILSDAAEAVLAGAGALRGAVGAYGTVAVLMMCLLPFLQMGVHYLAYKLTSALSAAVADSRTAGLIDSIGTAFGLILGMTGAGALLQLVSLVSSLTVVAA